MEAVVEQIFPALTWRIRQLAMYPEKEITDMELPEDWDGMHFGLYYQYELTGVVSLFIDGETAQFRKMAVLPNDQGKGFGLQLLQYLVDYCKSQGIKNLWCNARVTATGFYQKLGFANLGEPYERNQISYIKMELTF
ncbi:GNAT family N-acetyltransferase [Pedobacter sp. SL55]|uniref:GNAT family N-acetyltransferase n=1 Tax=Pedobacter sp. SL55 TaxID=2995161 RepID=UPI00226F9E08|nr:GNAT family N-acetyltransferase [Pedobacter sp. SL55]WAC41211.1 GNAT family N-acetyltransferase [Pedobacter sp. SL55]